VYSVVPLPPEIFQEKNHGKHGRHGMRMRKRKRKSDI
jgi:hypothetical protein